MLGHASIATTQIYLSTPGPDELRAAIEKVSFGIKLPNLGYGPLSHPANPVEAPTGIEPV